MTLATILICCAFAQEASPSEDQYKQDCLSLVKGWKAGILEAVDNTSKDGITRNRIADRCADSRSPLYNDQYLLIPKGPAHYLRYLETLIISILPADCCQQSTSRHHSKVRLPMASFYAYLTIHFLTGGLCPPSPLARVVLP